MVKYRNLGLSFVFLGFITLIHGSATFLMEETGTGRDLYPKKHKLFLKIKKKLSSVVNNLNFSRDKLLSHNLSIMTKSDYSIEVKLLIKKKVQEIYFKYKYIP